MGSAPTPDSSIRSFWADETGRLAAYVEGLASDDIDRIYSWKSDGATTEATLSMIVAHIVNHERNIAANSHIT